jgi:hypothetical protein
VIYNSDKSTNPPEIADQLWLFTKISSRECSFHGLQKKPGSIFRQETIFDPVVMKFAPDIIF